MDKYIIHYDTMQFNTKPTSIEAGLISKRITGNAQEMTRMQIYELLCKGQTVVGAFLGQWAPRQQANFQSQSLFMLDFDNDDTDNQFTMEQALSDPYMKENASFIYPTFNNTAEKNKFRVAFFTEKAVESASDSYEVYLMLLDKYPMADPKCVDTSRMFYGGTEGTIISLDNTLALPTFKGIEVTKRGKVKSYAITEGKTHFEPQYIQAYRSRDVDTLKSLYGGKYAKSYKSRKRALTYLKNLNMRELLGLPSGALYSLTREETTPSSSIFKLDGEGVDLYNDFGSRDSAKDIVGVVHDLLPYRLGDDYSTTLDFLLEVLGIKVDEERFSLEKSEKELLTSAIGMLSSKKELKKFPAFDVLFNSKSKREMAYNLLVLFRSESIMESFSDNSARLLTRIPLPEMCERLGTNIKTLLTTLRILFLSGILVNLRDDELPKHLLTSLKNTQARTLKGYRMSVYTIGRGTTLQELNDKIEAMPNYEVLKDRRNHKTEVLEVMYGREFAEKLTPHEYTEAHENDKDFIVAYQGFAKHLIKTKGYAISEDIMNMILMTRDYCTEDIANDLYDKYADVINYIPGLTVRNLLVSDKKEYAIPIGDTNGQKIYLEE